MWDGMRWGMLRLMVRITEDLPAASAWTGLWVMSVLSSCCLARIEGVLLLPFGVPCQTNFLLFPPQMLCVHVV